MEDEEARERRLLAEDEEDEEDVQVHTESKAVQPEDEDFMKEFDRMMGETYKSVSTAPQAQGPVNELIVPEAARQRFQRKICFDEPTSHKVVAAPSSPPKVALLIRGKNNRAELRAVEVHDERLEQTWEAEKEEHRREQQRMKQLTLQMTKRQQLEEEQNLN